MTQTARKTPWWLRLYEQAQDFAQQVIESVDADLAAMTAASGPEPGPARPSRDDEKARNEWLGYTFGCRWQHHHQHHDTNGGSVNDILLRVWREAAPAANDIREVASSTRHCPVTVPRPTLN